MVDCALIGNPWVPDTYQIPFRYILFLSFSDRKLLLYQRYLVSPFQFSTHRIIFSFLVGARDAHLSL